MPNNSPCFINFQYIRQNVERFDRDQYHCIDQYQYQRHVRMLENFAFFSHEDNNTCRFYLETRA